MKKHQNCVVPGCESIENSLNPELKFYPFPKEDGVKKKWLKAINRSDEELNKRSKVCSKHFKNSDYSITRFNYTVGGKNNPSTNKNTCEWKVLKSETVPSLHLPEKSTFKIKISKKDNSKEVKVEEIKVKEEKIKEEKVDRTDKVKMPKKSLPPPVEVTPVISRSRRQASKEALKQMQILLEDEDDTVEIPSDDDYSYLDIIPVEPTPPPPPKKKYKLSHRKSSDGNERDVLVLKTITNRDAENTLELECWVEQLEDVQKARIKKIQEEEKELQAKLDSLINQANAKVIHKGDLNTIIEVTETVQNTIQSAQNPPPNIILNNNLSGASSYQLVMDPRLGLIVGAVNTTESTSTVPQKVYQGKVTVAQNLQQTPTTSINNQSTAGRVMRTRRGSKVPAPPTPIVVSSPQTRSVIQTKTSVVPTKTSVVPTKTSVVQTKTSVVQAKTLATKTTTIAKIMPPPKAVPPLKTVPSTKVTTVKITQPSKITPTTRSPMVTRSTPQLAKNSPSPAAKATPPAKKVLTPTVTAPVTRARQPASSYNTSRPNETNVEGGLATGGSSTVGVSVTTPAPVVDLTNDDGRSIPDSREIAFNKLQGKTYPSLVVVARPHLRVTDLGSDRPKLDSKVKAVLMHAPTKFTEWLIQQGLVRSEQKCSVHPQTALKLGMYSDVSKFPYSGGYVWISECCPQRFVSVFSGSLFEGSPHPPMVILKLLYHWACQTNIQNVTQWVKVDNLYVKGMFTWLRSICTVAIQTHLRQLGGPGQKIEVGVISLGTTSQDGNQRQVKVEVLGVFETTSKLIRLRAVEPQSESDRNYKKRFSKILEPIQQWVHPQSTLVADLTVDKQTLHNMGFTTVIQSSSSEYGSNNRTIMEYLRRIVPRMFQNTLSLLSRQIIQQFLDELVWREWFGTSTLQAFDNVVTHLAEQTRCDTGQSLIVRLNKIAQNPFKSWAITLTSANNVKPLENTQTSLQTQQNKKQRNRNKQENPKQTQQAPVDINRPPKSTSPDVPEQMVPLENYYYGTIDTYSKTPTISLNMKCPFCKALFNNNIQLMNHLFKHAHNVSQDAQLCRYCLTSVPTANDLLKHISSSHPAETKFDNGFVCLICETQYMNPFVLGKHMSKEHCPSELPYQCGTCNYRCSNHKQAIDHFYKTHDNGPTIQCPFCLKSTTVFSSSRNIVQNMNYFIQHLQKHQRKQFARRCGKCNLWFVQKDVLRDHQMRMHVSQRGKPGLVQWVAPRNGVMVPKSRMDKYPGDADVINFTTLFFNLPKNLVCKECNSPMDLPKHFPSFESCQNPNCQYSTCCTNAMQEHNAKCNKSHNPVAEEKLPFELFCVCGYSNTDGNQMARHLAICERKSAYPSKTEAKAAIVTHSMLDVLGLVRKPDETKKDDSDSAVFESTSEVTISKVNVGQKGIKRKRGNDSKTEEKSVSSSQTCEETKKKKFKASKETKSITENIVEEVNKSKLKKNDDHEKTKDSDMEIDAEETQEKGDNKAAETENTKDVPVAINKELTEKEKNQEDSANTENEDISKVTEREDKNTENLEKENETEINDEKKTEIPEEEKETEISEEEKETKIHEEERETEISEEEKEIEISKEKEIKIPEEERETKISEEKETGIPEEKTEAKIPEEQETEISEETETKIPEEETETKIHEKETENHDVEKEIKALDEEKETEIVQEEKKTESLDEENETESLDEENETESLNEEKETENVQEEKETGSVQEEKETECIQEEKETESVQVEQETESPQEEKETEHIEVDDNSSINSEGPQMDKNADSENSQQSINNDVEKAFRSLEDKAIEEFGELEDDSDSDGEDTEVIPQSAKKIQDDPQNDSTGEFLKHSEEIQDTDPKETEPDETSQFSEGKYPENLNHVESSSDTSEIDLESKSKRTEDAITSSDIHSLISDMVSSEKEESSTNESVLEVTSYQNCHSSTDVDVVMTTPSENMEVSETMTKVIESEEETPMETD